MEYLIALLVFLGFVLVIAVLILLFAEPAAKAIGRFLVRIEHYKRVFGHTDGEKRTRKPTEGSKDGSEELDRVMIQVATWYYVDDMSIDEIADSLYIGARQVNRHTHNWRELVGIKATRKTAVMLEIKQNPESWKYLLKDPKP